MLTRKDRNRHFSRTVKPADSIIITIDGECVAEISASKKRNGVSLRVVADESVVVDVNVGRREEPIDGSPK